MFPHFCLCLLSFLMFISLLLIHILLHARITMLFLYLMATAAFYGRLTERQKEKGVFKSNNARRKGFSCCFASLCVEQTIEPSPPPRWVHKLIAYYVTRQGEITVFFPYLARFLFHIFENILRQFPDARVSCLNWTLLSSTVQYFTNHMTEAQWCSMKYLNKSDSFIQKILNQTTVHTVYEYECIDSTAL